LFDRNGNVWEGCSGDYDKTSRVFLNIVLLSGDQAVVGSLAPALGGTMANVLGSAPA
jgi:hypothetical protein